jgi:hypothetical protein
MSREIVCSLCQGPHCPPEPTREPCVPQYCPPCNESMLCGCREIVCPPETECDRYEGCRLTCSGYGCEHQYPFYNECGGSHSSSLDGTEGDDQWERCWHECNQDKYCIQQRCRKDYGGDRTVASLGSPQDLNEVNQLWAGPQPCEPEQDCWNNDLDELKWSGPNTEQTDYPEGQLLALPDGFDETQEEELGSNYTPETTSEQDPPPPPTVQKFGTVPVESPSYEGPADDSVGLPVDI